MLQILRIISLSSVASSPPGCGLSGPGMQHRGPGFNPQWAEEERKVRKCTPVFKSMWSHPQIPTPQGSLTGLTWQKLARFWRAVKTCTYVRVSLNDTFMGDLPSLPTGPACPASRPCSHCGRTRCLSPRGSSAPFPRFTRYVLFCLSLADSYSPFRIFRRHLPCEASLDCPVETNKVQREALSIWALFLLFYLAPQVSDT